MAKLKNGVVVEKYLWANLTTLLAVYDGNDNLLQRFEYADQRMPIAMTYNAQKYYLHYDQVGSLRAVTDASHNIVKEISYDTYGNIISDSDEAFRIAFGFAGGLYDQDTKLTRFGYRDYDAYTGKWTAKDPIDFSGGDTNLYGYVLGDPVNFVDPWGLAKICYRPLNFYGIPVGIAGIGTALDRDNNVIGHQHIFFDDGTNIGHGADGPMKKEEFKDYSYCEAGYDDDKLKEAVKKTPFEEYDFFWKNNNCQDWIDRVKNNY